MLEFSLQSRRYAVIFKSLFPYISGNAIIFSDWMKNKHFIYFERFIKYSLELLQKDVFEVYMYFQEKFTFSLDERFVLNGGYMGFLEWILFKDYSQK